MEFQSEKDNYLEKLIAQVRAQEFDGEIIFSLYENGKPVAEMELLDYSSGFHTKCKVYLLNTIGVNEKYRGRGYASALLERLNRFLKDQGAIAYLRNGAYSNLRLWDINSKKPIDMKSIYERHGYKYIDESYDYMVNLLYTNQDDADVFLSEFQHMYSKILPRESA